MIPALAGRARQGAGRVRPAGARARAGGAAGAIARVAAGARARRGPRARISSAASVIEALGDYKAAYARRRRSPPSRSSTARSQEDAALALGQIGDKRALETLAGLQRTAPRDGAAVDRRGDLPARRQLRRRTRTTGRDARVRRQEPGFQELLRGAAAASARSAWRPRRGRRHAVRVGIPSRDPTRAPVALALATVALRNTPLMLSSSRSAPTARRRSSCSAKGSTCSRRISPKERFFAVVRHAYWSAPADRRRAS